MARILFLLGPGFEDLEFFVPYMRLQEAGHQVTVAGEKQGEEIKGKNGLPFSPSIAFDTVKQTSFDALVIPGGWAPDKLRRSEKVKKLVRDAHGKGKIIGMICHAGLVGISAGIVSGQPATGSEGIKDDLINAGAEWRDEPAFRSGNIVWGRVVADIPQFNAELVKALDGSK